ncbi:MAG: glycosyltransferase family 2 protein [Sphingobacteriaceae bacterium]|jgi:GT2 family glycosyltransferase|nr:glycosyltransferase family 2 protein [Sphingobacteriaceae bacterium]
MDDKRSISIVIPNYNGKHLLEKYLPYTIEAAINSSADYEIIIVDDGSTDDSVSFIKQEYAHLVLVESDANKGFSHTCNAGIQASKNDLIFLLNSDVKLLPHYFDAQWKYFEKADTFGVMGRIIDMEGDGLQDTARALKFNGFKFKTDFFYSLTPSDHVPTLYLSGANALIDAKKLKGIGGFDEIFSPFYGEDLDLGFRAWRMGWKCYYEHHSICRHQISATTKTYKTSSWVKTIYFRNRFYVHAIHLSGIPKLFWVFQILADIVSKIFTGQYWIFNSYKALFTNSKAIRSSKENLKALMAAHHSKRSIKDVHAEFNSMLIGLNIKWLKD